MDALHLMMLDSLLEARAAARLRGAEATMLRRRVADLERKLSEATDTIGRLRGSKADDLFGTLFRH